MKALIQNFFLLIFLFCACTKISDDQKSIPKNESTKNYLTPNEIDCATADDKAKVSIRNRTAENAKDIAMTVTLNNNIITVGDKDSEQYQLYIEDLSTYLGSMIGGFVLQSATETFTLIEPDVQVKKNAELPFEFDTLLIHTVQNFLKDSEEGVDKSNTYYHVSCKAKST